MFIYLGEEIDGTEESKSNVRVSTVSFNGGFMLNNPKGKIYSHSFVSEEIEAFISSVRFE